MSKWAVETAKSLIASSIAELASIDAAMKVREHDVQRLKERRLNVEAHIYEMERWLAESNVANEGGC